MKSIAKIVTATVLLSVSALSANAATSAERAAQLCKSEALEQFSSPEQAVRVKFKSINGPRRAPVVTLKVFPAGADSYQAVCEADVRQQQITSMTVVR